jgi:hypothetical protein
MGIRAILTTRKSSKTTAFGFCYVLVRAYVDTFDNVFHAASPYFSINFFFVKNE